MPWELWREQLRDVLAKSLQEAAGFSGSQANEVLDSIFLLAVRASPLHALDSVMLMRIA